MSRKLACLAGESALRHVTKHVLEVLADISDHEGRNCYPAVGYIAWRTSLSERAVHNAMAELRDLGIISVESRPGRSNLLTIHADKIPPAPPYRPRKTDTTWDPDQMETPDPTLPEAPEECTTCAAGGAPRAPLDGHEGGEGVHDVHPRGAPGAGGGARRAPISGTYPGEYPVQREGARAPARETPEPIKGSPPDSEPECVTRAALEYWRSHRMDACLRHKIKTPVGKAYDLQNMREVLEEWFGENETRESALQAVVDFLETPPSNHFEQTRGFDAACFRGFVKGWIARRSTRAQPPASNITIYDGETRRSYTPAAYQALQQSRNGAPPDPAKRKPPVQKPADALREYAENNPGSTFAAQIVEKMASKMEMPQEGRAGG